MPERRLPDGSYQIYEAPGTLGMQVKTMTIDELLAIDKEVNDAVEKEAIEESPFTET